MPSMSMNSKALWYLLAVPLFATALVVYANAVPASFNKRYENRVFFDSDGELLMAGSKAHSVPSV